jgi:phosphate starvation-inducible protein PhoH
LKTQTPTQPSYFIPEPLDNTRLAHLCGPLDENLRQISAALDVTIFRRGEKFIVSGANAERAVELLERFYAVANKVVPIEEVQLALVEQRAGLKPTIADAPAALEAKKAPGETVSEEAGDLERDESGELVSPMLKTRPLYDALYDLLGFDRTQKLFEKQVIEIAPLAFMRGRTLNHAFVILDEAQNTTVEQMKMFLTRIGFGSKAVVTGDVTQVDLHKTQRSGLVDAMHVLKDVRGIAFTQFSSADVCAIRWSAASSMPMKNPRRCRSLAPCPACPNP